MLGPGDRVVSKTDQSCALGSPRSSEERWMHTVHAAISRWAVLGSFLTAACSFPLDERLSEQCCTYKAFLLSTDVRKVSAILLQGVERPYKGFKF